MDKRWFEKMAWVAAIGLLLLLGWNQATKVIKISVDGKNDPQCLHNSSFPCLTLSYVLDHLAVFNATTLMFLPGQHNITRSMRLQNVHNLSLIGVEGVSKPVIRCLFENQSHISLGFSFMRSHYLVVQNLQVQGCRLAQASPSSRQQNANLHAAMFLAYCMHVRFVDVGMLENRGKAIIMYNVGGNVIFKRVTFIGNRGSNTTLHCPLSQRDDNTPVFNMHKSGREPGRQFSESYEEQGHGRSYEGGGIFLEYNSCGVFPYLECSDSSESKLYTCDSHVVFESCVFEENGVDDVNVSESHSDHWESGRGGGILLLFKEGAENNTVEILNCTFARNCAKWGAGLFAQFQNGSQGNHLFIGRNTTFANNNATLAGGGVRLTAAYGLAIREPNQFSFADVLFKSNAALWGGGVSMSHTLWLFQEPKVAQEKAMVHFNSCHFESNRATVGSALGLVSSLDDRVPYKYSYEVCLYLCTVHGNVIDAFGDNIQGQGALYSDALPIILGNGTRFTANSGTALVLVGTQAIISGYVQFQENSGLDGGAVALYDGSWLKLKEGTTVLLKRNHARSRGGALFFMSAGPPRMAFKTTQLATSSCFICYENHLLPFDPSQWNCSILFINNTANALQGKSIYATTLQNCRRNYENRYQVYSLSQHPFIYDNFNDSENPHIVTSPNQVTFIEMEWQQPPSISFSPHVTFMDELSNHVVGTMSISLINSSQIELSTHPGLYVTNNSLGDLSLQGRVGKDFRFQFNTASGQIVSSAVGTGIIKRCPIGFFQPKNSLGCKCLVGVVHGLTRCNGSKVYVLRNHWGREGSDHLELVPCPLHYCKCDKDQHTPLLSCLFNYNKQCEDNRNGRLCSKCKKGYSVLLGNEKCLECSPLWSLLFIPLILFLSGMVIVVMFFNIDAFSGYLNAFLYSYQVITVLLNSKFTLDPFIGFVIGITGISGTGDALGVCIIPHMDDFVKLALNYGMATYIVSFTIILGKVLPMYMWDFIFSRGNSRGNDIRRRSFGQALACVCVFCYSWYTWVSVAVLHPVSINGTLWVYYYAEDKYFQTPRHIVFGVIAILTVIFIVIGFPFVLLFPSFFTKHVQWILRGEPILDNLRDCFQNAEVDGKDRQYFAAFYFIARALVLLISVLVNDELIRMSILVLFCIILLFVFCWFQPYRQWTMNFWDCLLLLNLSCVSFLSTVQTVLKMLDIEVFKQAHTVVDVVVRTLVYVPFVVLFLRLVNLVCEGRKQPHGQHQLEEPLLEYTQNDELDEGDQDGRRLQYQLPRRVEEYLD